MRGRWMKSLALLGLLLPAAAFGADPVRVGVVKGSITVGGKPSGEVVVSVEGVGKANLKAQISDLKSKKAVVDQRELGFVPRVSAVLVGSTVEFPNNDKTFHNVFSNSEAKRFDLGLYASGKSRSVVLDKAGVVKVLCNVHPNMEAYVVVKNHPYYAVTNSRGNYSLNGIPLGKYRLEVWHPDFGVKVVPFALVREGEVLALDVEMKTQK